LILVLAPAVSALFVSWHDPSPGIRIACSFFSVTEQILWPRLWLVFWRGLAVLGFRREGRDRGFCERIIGTLELCASSFP
jgi:hypothetical protein